MHWIIENLTREASYLALAEAARIEGIPLLEINGDFQLAQLEPLKTKVVTVNGSITMVELMREHLPACLIFSSQAKYLCTRYYPVFGDLLFNDQYAILPFVEFQRQRKWIYEIVGRDGLVFVRPDSGEKTFKAQLIEETDLDEIVAGQVLDPQQLVILSNPKNIRGEWRFVVSQAAGIVAMSSYQIDRTHRRQPFAPEGAVACCQAVWERRYHPDSIYCVDIAQDDDGEFWLLELTAFASAGLYACDMTAVSRAVREVLLQAEEAASGTPL